MLKINRLLPTTFKAVFLLSIGITLGGCSAQREEPVAPTAGSAMIAGGAVVENPAASAATDEPSLDPVSAPVVQEVYDPIEGFNRAMFSFNDKLYVVLLRPLSKLYDAITPNGVQRGVHNFFSNIRYPIYLVSDFVQLKFDDAGNHTMRFLINTTAGVAGIFDVAKDFDYPEKIEDFGQGLAYQGVGEGPYIVVPFLGPSNARDLVGRIVDGFLHPVSYVNYFDVDEATQWQVTLGARGLEVIDDTNRASEAIDLAKEASVDFYLFVRSAYHQRRESLIHDGNVPGSAAADEPTLDSDTSDVPIIGQ